MAKIIIHAPSSSTAAELRDALNNPQNAFDAVSATQDTVEVVINNRTDAAFDLLAGILTALPWYNAPGSGMTLAEILKQTARIVDGKRRDRQIDEAVNEAVNGPADHGIIDPRTNTAKDGASNWRPRRDPLTLDLDGDGLETTGVAATNPILFDHDGDGIKNGTGWVNADDGFLVRDVNGNGTIDSGRELFGDSTIKSNGQLATDGFNALADLDSITNGGNADGKISNLDAQFTNLRIWRDLNQDGISQTGELFTLASLNIASINVASTANSQTLPNGNQIADLGTFTKTDGSTGSTGAITGNLADINLASDTFHRTFPNVLDATSVTTLPDMQAYTRIFLSSNSDSSKVCDLREAANDTEWRVAA